MRVILIGLAVSILSLPLTGCHCRSREVAEAGFVSSHGGVGACGDAARLTRLQGELEDSARQAGIGDWPPVHLQFQVLNEAGLGAYAWPSGSIYLSAGLLALSDPELKAAMAHEWGHLFWHYLPGAQGLMGRGQELEYQADAMGVCLLGPSGRQMMLKLLKTLESQAPPPMAGALRRRQEKLTRPPSSWTPVWTADGLVGIPR